MSKGNVSPVLVLVVVIIGGFISGNILFGFAAGLFWFTVAGGFSKKK